MQIPPIPADEAARLAALHRYPILDTPAEASFDRLSALAARLFQVPLVFVSFVDEDRQWFKSCQGPASAGIKVAEMPRNLAFCAHTILHSEVLVIEDTLLDERFHEHPLATGDPHIRFYAGAPLLTAEGHAVGTLCLVDFQPRIFSSEQQDALRDLAASVVSEMDLRLALLIKSQSERLHREMFENNPHPMWVFDVETLEFLAVNEIAIAHYGYTREEFRTMTLCDIRSPQERELLRSIRPVHGAGSDHRGIWRHRKKDGAEIEVAISSHSIDFEGRSARMVIADDVTERRRAEEALRRSEQKLSRHMHLTPLAAIELAPDLTITGWNPAAETVFGYTCEEASGQNIISLLVPDEVRAHVEQLHEDVLAQTGGARSTNYNRTKSGATILCEWYNTSLTDETGQIIGFASMAQNVTEREKLECEREELLAQTEALLSEALERADHDPLTGLLNHRAFHKCLEEESERARESGKPLALLLFDLDNFKFFNDAHGHLAGDEALRQAAQTMNACCGPLDTLARFGGDEFALLMPKATAEAAAVMAQEIREAMRRTGYSPTGATQVIPISLSVGAAVLPDDGPGRLDALNAADARLRFAKSGGEDESQAMRLRQTLTRSREGFSMLDALVTAVDNKDRYTRSHSEDVMAYSLQIARELGLAAEKQHTVAVAALLHDVGKIGVPDSVLRKPGRLSEEDFGAIKQHPLMGSVIVGAVPGFEETLDAVRHHHERWDGEGYPFGLSGEETPLIARLMAVADAYSAMTTDRPYRKGMESAQARQILREGAGTQWDTNCVEAFLRA